MYESTFWGAVTVRLARGGHLAFLRDELRQGIGIPDTIVSEVRRLSGSKKKSKEVREAALDLLPTLAGPGTWVRRVRLSGDALTQRKRELIEIQQDLARRPSDPPTVRPTLGAENKGEADCIATALAPMPLS